MGGGHSTETRSIIVEESNGSGVVKVSEETASRLLGGHSGSGGGTSKDGKQGYKREGELGDLSIDDHEGMLRSPGSGFSGYGSSFSRQKEEEKEQKKVIEKSSIAPILKGPPASGSGENEAEPEGKTFKQKAPGPKKSRSKESREKFERQQEKHSEDPTPHKKIQGRKAQKHGVGTGHMSQRPEEEQQPISERGPFVQHPKLHGQQPGSRQIHENQKQIPRGFSGEQKLQKPDKSQGLRQQLPGQQGLNKGQRLEQFQGRFPHFPGWPQGPQSSPRQRQRQDDKEDLQEEHPEISELPGQQKIYRDQQRMPGGVQQQPGDSRKFARFLPPSQRQQFDEGQQLPTGQPRFGAQQQIPGEQIGEKPRFEVQQPIRGEQIPSHIKKNHPLLPPHLPPLSPPQPPRHLQIQEDDQIDSFGEFQGQPFSEGQHFTRDQQAGRPVRGQEQFRGPMQKESPPESTPWHYEPIQEDDQLKSSLIQSQRLSKSKKYSWDQPPKGPPPPGLPKSCIEQQDLKEDQQLQWDHELQMEQEPKEDLQMQLTPELEEQLQRKQECQEQEEVEELKLVKQHLREQAQQQRESDPCSGDDIAEQKGGKYEQYFPENYVPRQMGYRNKKFRSSREWQAKLNEMELGYRKRIIELEKHNAELYQTTSEQLARAVEEVEEKFSIVKAKPVCKEQEQRVFKCYLENPKHPLRCSKEVALFRECVKQQRELLFEKTRVTS